MTPEQEAKLKHHAIIAVGRVSVDVPTVLAMLEERRALKEALAALLREDMGGRDPVSARTQAELDAEAALALAARPVGE